MRLSFQSLKNFDTFFRSKENEAINYTWNNKIFLLSAVVLILTPFISFSASAQASFDVIKTENPDEYAAQIVDDIESEGMSAVRALFEDMGLSSPQSEATISIYEQTQNSKDKRWTNLIGVVESGEVLKQYYGYAYLGGNAWIFFRIEFLRAGEKEWALSKFMFNSEHAAIIAADLNFVD